MVLRPYPPSFVCFKMNVFYIDEDPAAAARSMYDRHVVKMILESAQILSTAHRVLDGTMQVDRTGKRAVTGWRHPDPTLDSLLYKPTHMNHPSTVWARHTVGNYLWLYHHLLGLMAEYTHRYGKIHACDKLSQALNQPPKNCTLVPFYQPPSCMPDEYKVSSKSLDNYREYYKVGKSELRAYTNRQPPDWLS